MNLLMEDKKQNVTEAPLYTPGRGEGLGVRFYLLQLYRYHKGLFACMALFWLGQLIVFYKKGMLVTPWYNYGMYSAKMYPQDTLEVNQQLTGPSWLYLLSPQRDDKVNVTLDYYRNRPTNDSLYRKEITRIVPMVGLPKPPAGYYQYGFSGEQFDTWFRHYTDCFGNPLPATTAQPVAAQKMRWDGSKLVTISK